MRENVPANKPACGTCGEGKNDGLHSVRRACCRGTWEQRRQGMCEGGPGHLFGTAVFTSHFFKILVCLESLV